MQFDLEKITQALSAAAVDSTRWAGAMETVAACTESTGAVLLPLKGSMPYLPGSASLEKSFATYVEGGWINNDVRYRGTATMMESGVCTESDFISDDAIKKDPYYQEFLARCGLRNFAGVKVGSGDTVWCLSIQRSLSEGVFTTPEIQALRQLSVRLESVAATASALAFAHGHAALSAFDVADKAAVLLDRRGDVVRVNGMAERLFDGDISIVNRRLVSSNPRATGDLNDAVKKLLWTRQSSSVPSILFQREGRGPVIVYAMAWPNIRDLALSAFHAVAVLVDPDTRAQPAMRTLQSGFGLTPAEARLALALVSGGDLNSESARLGLSRETIRKQLRAVFGKTGTRRQVELVAMLANLLSGR